MENSLNVKKKSGIIIFEVKGYLDETNATKVFEKINSEIGEPNKDTKIILNFDGLTYLNSKSIGSTADIISRIEDNGGGIYISNCSDTIKDTLELVGITNMVTIVDDFSEAIDELNK